ncbi:hypothetical protein LOZ66_004042 [Ophidiomyces ophidiicola]|nr:hypothetical protein LOZ66_004042 [Ophidiomyces ophidiicola]
MNEIPGTELVMPCWNSLDCTLKDLDSMAMIDRLKFIQYMTRRKLSHLGSENQFNAIEAVIGFFVTRGLGTQGTVMSLINAVGLEAIQRGVAISLGYSNSTAGNPAASKWATFLDQRKTGKLVDRDMHDRAWSIAEQTAVNYGIQLAYSRPDLKPLTQREQRWHQFTNVFRTIMQHRQTLLWLIKMWAFCPLVLVLKLDFLDRSKRAYSFGGLLKLGNGYHRDKFHRAPLGSCLAVEPFGAILEGWRSGWRCGSDAADDF